MSEYYELYVALDKKWDYIRWRNNGVRSEEEEELLAEMDRVWYHLTEEEQESIDRRAPTNSVGGIAPKNTDRCVYDVDGMSCPGKPHLEIAEETRGCT